MDCSQFTADQVLLKIIISDLMFMFELPLYFWLQLMMCKSLTFHVAPAQKVRWAQSISHSSRWVTS